MKNKKILKQKIAETIQMNEYQNGDEIWQPIGEEKNHCIIEQKEPFFWRINPKWAELIAERILEKITKVVNLKK